MVSARRTVSAGMVRLELPACRRTAPVSDNSLTSGRTRSTIRPCERTVGTKARLMPNCLNSTVTVLSRWPTGIGNSSHQEGGGLAAHRRQIGFGKQGDQPVLRQGVDQPLQIHCPAVGQAKEVRQVGSVRQGIVGLQVDAEAADAAKRLPIDAEAARDLARDLRHPHPQVHLQLRAHDQPVLHRLAVGEAAREGKGAFGLRRGGHFAQQHQAGRGGFDAHIAAGQQAADGGLSSLAA